MFQPEKNTKVAVMHYKCHSYLPGSPRSGERLVEHRNSTPAIHLKLETSAVTSDSLTSLSPRTRHGTWSHSQQQEVIVWEGELESNEILLAR